MNILMLHSSSDLYGASKILLHTVGYLIHKGHRVIVVLSEYGELAQKLEENNCIVRIVRLGILRRKYFNVSGLINRIKTIYKATSTIADIVKQYEVDIIYSNTTGVLAGAFVANKFKKPHIWHIHEIITKPGWFLKLLGWIVNSYSDKVIVVSAAVMKHWEKYISRKKIHRVYNGINYEEYLVSDGSKFRKENNFTKDEFLIGMIGRVHYWKGQSYFLEMATYISEEYKNIRFVMVGDAFPGYEYLYDQLKDQKEKAGISEIVIDLGYRKDIPEILAALDIFILPSILPDPFPTVILEAMASGKAVCATAHGGALEIIENGKSGVHIPWDDAKKGAGIISTVIGNEEYRKELGNNGRQRVLENFSEYSYNRKIEEIIFQSFKPAKQHN